MCPFYLDMTVRQWETGFPAFRDNVVVSLSFFLNILTLQNETITLFRNVRNPVLNDKVSYPRRNN
jgi:hypothetical protein